MRVDRQQMLVSLAVLVYLGLGLYLSRVLVTWDDEGGYLALGRKLVTGELTSLFVDELSGHRMPLPFYVLGASQFFGPSLLAGRWLSLALGLGVLGLAVVVARRLEGPTAGVLAGLFLATQGVVVGYYATAVYFSLAGLMLLAAVWALLRRDLPWHAPLGMALALLLFFTRTNLFPALPFFFVWALARAQSTFERATILFVTLVAPLAFFPSHPLHLKLLAYIPGLSLLVEPLRYQSIIALQERPRPDLFQQLWSVGLVMRRYESWTLAAAGLGLAVVAACRRSSRRAAVPNPDAVVVTVLFGWLLLSHFAMYSVAGNVKWVAAYFASFAALGAVVLGVLAAWVWHRVALEHPARAIAAVAIAVGLTISVAIIRHPLLPTQRPRLFEDDAVGRLEVVRSELGGLIPPGTRVFVFGQNTPVYLAGLDAPLQQVMSSTDQFVAPQDASTIARNGGWGRAELERWLGFELDWAIVSPTARPAASGERVEANLRRMAFLLEERFVRVGRVGTSPYFISDVYRRRH